MAVVYLHPADARCHYLVGEHPSIRQLTGRDVLHYSVDSCCRLSRGRKQKRTAASIIYAAPFPSLTAFRKRYRRRRTDRRTWLAVERSLPRRETSSNAASPLAEGRQYCSSTVLGCCRGKGAAPGERRDTGWRGFRGSFRYPGASWAPLSSRCCWRPRRRRSTSAGEMGPSPTGGG